MSSRTKDRSKEGYKIYYGYKLQSGNYKIYTIWRRMEQQGNMIKFLEEYMLYQNTQI